MPKKTYYHGNDPKDTAIVRLWKAMGVQIEFCDSRDFASLPPHQRNWWDDDETNFIDQNEVYRLKPS